MSIGARPITTVLVVSGGGFQGWGLVQALRSRKATRIVVCDIHAEGITRYAADHYEVVPPVSDPDFDDCLFALVAREHIDAIFPSSVHELQCLSRLAPRFEADGVKVAVPPPDILACLLDKMETTLWLASLGVPVQLPTAFAEAEAALPLLGKARHGWGGQGMRTVRTLADIRKQRAIGDFDDHLWVPLLENFSEYSADVALGPHGERSALVIRRRLRTSGGFSVISESVENDAIARVFGVAIEALLARRAHGLFNLQVISPSNSDAFVSDINPRIGTSASHALAEGINLVDAYLAMRSDAGKVSMRDSDQRPPTQPRRQLKTIRLLQDRVIPRIKKPKAVIFDLDDTLIDHKRWISDRLSLAVTDRRLWASTKSFSSTDLALQIAQAIDEGERRLLIDRVAQVTGLDRDLLLASYRDAVPKTIEIYPDVLPTFQRLRARKIAIGILTDNPPQSQSVKLGLMLKSIMDCVDAIIFSRDGSAEKPDSSGFFRVANALNLDPHDCVMVGDNYFRDAVGAIRAGFGNAFLLKREGAFINSNPGLGGAAASRYESKIHVIYDLSTLRETVVQ